MMRNNDALDILKFVMAISIVAMHANLFYGCPLQLLVWPWARLSVPLFFVISSYFYFKSGRRYSDLCRRILSLYSIWFFLTLADTVLNERAGWLFGADAVECAVRFVVSFLFGGLFGASWYLAALLWGVFIVESFLSKLPSRGFLGCVLVLYCFCVLSSFCNWRFYYVIPQQSLCIGIVWVSIGYAFSSDKMGWLESLLANKSSRAIVMMGGVMFLLWLEWAAVWYVTRLHMNDCYLSLLPLVILVFALLIRIERPLLPVSVRLLRRYSVVMFMSHLTVLALAKDWIGNQVFYNVPVFLISVFGAVLLYHILEMLSRTPGLAFIRKAY